QHVLAQLDEPSSRTHMLAVGRGYNQAITKPRRGGQVASVVEPLVGRHPEPVGKSVTTIDSRIGNRYHMRTFRVLLRKAREGVAPRACTDHCNRYRRSHCDGTPLSLRMVGRASVAIKHDVLICHDGSPRIWAVLSSRRCTQKLQHIFAVLAQL